MTPESDQFDRICKTATIEINVFTLQSDVQVVTYLLVLKTVVFTKLKLKNKNGFEVEYFESGSRRGIVRGPCQWRLKFNLL